MLREDFLNSVEEKDERLESLKKLYPEIFSDGKINLDAFKDATGISELPENEDKTPGYYGLYWPGKRAAKQLAQKPATGTLQPVPGDGVNEDSTHNIYIEGDNLEVLRTLRNSYRGRVKLIYIDPPYNTGNDFVYPDDYSEPVESYLKLTGQIDDKGSKLVSNPKSSGTFHRNWLSMMYSRLLIAYELLTDGGAIFISIDDNEQANLKILCDDVFGEENFLNCIAVKMSEPSGVKMTHADKKLPKLKEYVLVYKKGNINLNVIKIPKSTWDSEYKTVMTNISQKEIEFIKSVIANENRTESDFNKCNELLSKAECESLSSVYKKENVEKNEQIKFNYQNSYRIFQTVSMSSGSTELINQKRKEYCKNKFFAYTTKENKVYIIKGDYDLTMKKPRVQVLFAEDYLTVNPCDFWQDIKTTGLDNEGDVEFKNGKKPLKLMKRIIEMVVKPNDIVMDFFSGSATTAEAVFQINEETSKNLKFILAQLPVSYDKSLESASGESKKQIQSAINFLESIGKPHTICETGKERIRRASKKSKGIDNGFRVYKLVESNFTKFNPIKGQDKNALKEVLFAFDNMVDPLIGGWKPENVLEEIKLRQGFALDCKVEIVGSINSNKVWYLEDPDRPISLYVCLDEKIEPRTVEELNVGENDKFICLNSAIDDTTYARLADKNRVQTL